METAKPLLDLDAVDEELVDKMVFDSLLWCSLHGLVVGDRASNVSVFFVYLFFPNRNLWCWLDEVLLFADYRWFVFVGQLNWIQ